MLKRPGFRAGRRRRALACTELALLLPFLGFLFVVAVDFARIFYYVVTLNNCCRNGAYYAADYPGIYGYGSTKAAAEADGGSIIPALADSDVTVLYSATAGGPY